MADAERRQQRSTPATTALKPIVLTAIVAVVAAMAAGCSGSSGHSGVISTTAPPTQQTGGIGRFVVPDEAMAPAMHTGQVIVVKVQPGPFTRGQIVVFKNPEPEVEPSIKDFVKRVIGLPGEVISCSRGVVYIDRKALTEPWIPAGVHTDDFTPVQIPAGDYFVIGDNRGSSADSRVFGPIPGGLVIGVVTQVLASPNQA